MEKLAKVLLSAAGIFLFIGLIYLGTFITITLSLSEAITKWKPSKNTALIYFSKITTAMRQ